MKVGLVVRENREDEKNLDSKAKSSNEKTRPNDVKLHQKLRQQGSGSRS